MKAGALVRGQYAPVGAAAIAGLGRARQALAAARRAAWRSTTLAATRRIARSTTPLRYRAAYNRYVAPFAGIDDLRIAPFHLLASEGAVHADKDHLWHMGVRAPPRRSRPATAGRDRLSPDRPR